MMDRNENGPEGGARPADQDGHEPSRATPSRPIGDHPSRVRDWADERIAFHKSARDDYRLRGEKTGAAMAAEAMLELMELKSFLGREFGVPFHAIATEAGTATTENTGVVHDGAGLKGIARKDGHDI